MNLENESSTIHFYTELSSFLVDNHLRKIDEELEQTIKEHDQKQYIQQIVKIYTNTSNNELPNESRNLLLNLFTKMSGKRTLKKYLQDIVNKCNLHTQIIKEATEEILQSLESKQICNVRQCIDLCNFITITQNDDTFNYKQNMEYIFPLYLKIFEAFVLLLRDFNSYIITEELSTLINAVTKQILTIFTKDILYSDLIYVKLVILSHRLLISDYVGFDLKTKAGLIMTYALNSVSEIYNNDFRYIDCPVLEFVEKYGNRRCLKLMDHELQVIESDDGIVILYASILSVIPHNRLIELKVEDEPLICLLYSSLMEYAHRVTNIPHIIVELSRTLSIVSKQLKKLPADLMKPMFLEGMQFVWSHIDHFVDTVRNYTKLFFTDLITIAAYHKSKGYTELAEVLVERVKSLGPTQELKLVSLEGIGSYISVNYLLEQFEHLPTELIGVMFNPLSYDQACKTYISLMEKHFTEVDNELWISTWVLPTKTSLKRTAVCQKIVITAFQLYPAILQMVFGSEDIESVQESVVLLKCLRYARQNGIELQLEKSVNTWRNLIDKERLEKFIIHQEDEIRLSALASIIESQKSTEIFLDWELNYLCTYLHYNITSESVNTRKQIVTLYKKGLSRYVAGLYIIDKNITRNCVDEFYSSQKVSYRVFLAKFIKQLISNLTFDSNFPRRATSLELLLVLERMTGKDEWLGYWTKDDIQNCHEILFDGYESNKQMAATLLRSLPSQYLDVVGDVEDIAYRYVQWCISLAFSLKPSQALSAMYLLEVCTYSPSLIEAVSKEVSLPALDVTAVLISKLEAQIKSGNGDEIDSKVAFYGVLLSIRHLLQGRNLSEGNQAYSAMFRRVTDLCMDLKNRIMPIVCNSSPEGYIPENDKNEVECDMSMKAQAILVYAWRTMKEMTLLLAEIVRQSVKLEAFVEMLDETTLTEIGEFFVNVFIESKHRGVYEQTYVGFCVVCQSFWSSSNPKLNSLPKRWLTQVMSLCTGGNKNEKLCATRRSAGLPFLILSMLSSERNLNKERIDYCITRLLGTCEDPGSNNGRYSMICMNILNAIFKQSRLGECITPYIEKAVMIAITGLGSQSWGIRNSATLLYGSLMTRMFGVQRTQDSVDLCVKNRMTVRVFSIRYPKLFTFLLETLAEQSTKSYSLMLHPVLLILARLYPSKFEHCTDKVEKCIPHLMRCLSNPVYKTRDLAARASVSFINQDQVAGHLDNIFSTINGTKVSNNECHGLLLQILHLLKSSDSPGDFDTFLQNCIDILYNVDSKFSHMTVTVCMEVITSFILKYPQYNNEKLLQSVCSIPATLNVPPLTSMGQYLQVRCILKIVLSSNDATYTTVAKETMSYLHGDNQQMKRFCLNCLIYMERYINDFDSDHALYHLGIMETPQQIITVVNTIGRNKTTKILRCIHQELKLYLIEELKSISAKKDLVLLFLLTTYYPCVLDELNTMKQDTLNMLLNFCKTEDEDLISSVISCISVFICRINCDSLKHDELVQVLVQSAVPTAKECRRYAVSDLLVKNLTLFLNEGCNLETIFNIAMVLLEDDELLIRNNMSNAKMSLKNDNYVGQRSQVIPEKAREDLLSFVSATLPKDRTICFLFSWACRTFAKTDTDKSEVFELGEQNLYVENVCFVHHCANLLNKLLWCSTGTKYTKEQTFLVTRELLHALVTHPSPMMQCSTKASVISALESLLEHLEQIGGDFKEQFELYFNQKFMVLISTTIERRDACSVKKILQLIYECVLSDEEQM